MLVYAAVVPHTPLLLPQIGKKNLKKLEKTLAAISELSEQLYLSRPETVIIIASHETKYPDAFSLNLNDLYQTDFSDFGDLSTSTSVQPDFELTTHIRRLGREREFPITLDTSNKLNFGTGVPIELFSGVLKQIPIVPISYSGLSPKQHLLFGSLLKEVIERSTKRIAVIASGDLSHCHTSDAPGGFHPDAKTFDAEITRAIQDLSQSTLLHIKEDMHIAAKACIYEQLLILFGILEHRQLKPRILSYEAPFGVGYLVAQFQLPI